MKNKLSDESDASLNYLLAVGERGAQNLNLQHQILKKRSIEQLKKAGIKKGMTVWDVGCGSGEMTEIIAKLVSPSGQVFAIDISQQQIDITKLRLTAAGYKNVTYLVGDVLDLNNNNFEKADIMHSRLLLMHVREPVKVIEKMISFLKPSGIISLQESSMYSLIDSGKNPALVQFYELLQSYGDLFKFNYNIGDKLPQLCEELNIFSKIEHYKSKFDLSSPNGKDLLFSRFDEIQSKLVENQLSTLKEMSILKAEIINYYHTLPPFSNCYIYTEQTHLIGEL